MKLSSVITAGSRCRRPRACLTGASALVLFAITAASHAQAANQIANIDPDSAAQGTLSLLVTFTLDNDFPPAPPAGVMPDTVAIGELVGTSVTHSSQYIVTAEFDVPGDEAPGLKDAAVVFTTPDGELTFALAAGFEVLLASDQPPVIVTQPVPQIVAPGGSAIFSIEAYGSEPLEYQWQKDELDIDGATEDVCVIDDASYDDAGLYRCVVSNEFGSAASDEAELVVRALPELRRQR